MLKTLIIFSIRIKTIVESSQEYFFEHKNNICIWKMVKRQQEGLDYLFIFLISM